MRLNNPSNKQSCILYCLIIISFIMFLFGNTVSALAKAPERNIAVDPRKTVAHSENVRFEAAYTYKDIHYNLTLINQAALNYKGYPVFAACTAASIGMITDYWTNGERKEEALDFAQYIVDANTRQGTFSPFSGLAIADTIDELSEKDYKLFIMYNTNKAMLLNSLETIGPIAVLVKSGWKRNGPNHMVVVSGYEAENDIVVVHDPNLNKPLRLYWGSFDKIWKIKYYGWQEKPVTRTFFVILPEDPLPRLALK